MAHDSNTLTDSPLAVAVEKVSHFYGERQALNAVNLNVQPGEIFGLLGPNGGGKTTLFRLLTTALELQSGQAHIFGHHVVTQSRQARQAMGVVFQSPSLDDKLTIRENLFYHGRLYGMSKKDIQQRIGDMLHAVGLADRANDIVGTLSGGLARRAELAKGLLHQPRLLILDEPSTGLDPGARHDVWTYLKKLRDQGVTLLVTTHLMEEAELCDRLALIHQGSIVVEGTPDALKDSLGGSILSIESQQPQELADQLEKQFETKVELIGQTLRFQPTQPAEKVGPLMQTFGDQVVSLTLSKPTLSDVFLKHTGHAFWDADHEE